jgi:hypothetical protein
MKKLMLASAVIGIMGASNAWAAGDCSAGGTASTLLNANDCTTEVSLNVQASVVLKNLSDISLANYVPATTDATGSSNFCLGTNDIAGATVTFASLNNDSGAFRLKGVTNDSEFITYSVIFDANDDNATAPPPVNVASGTPINISANYASNIACGTSDQSISLTATSAAIDAQLAQNYTDTITLTVQPQ